ncbi:oxidoreductase [Candidatus Pacearchaeota archaeon]|nr:oxidoreductase [Candidatus Pacearchaeota archaeon]
MIDPKLLDFAKTEIEKKTIEAVIKYINYKDAAKELNVTINAVNKAIIRVRRRAARKNYSTEFGKERLVPEGFTTKKVSKCFNRDGDLIINWVSAEPEKERQFELLKEAVVALSEPIKGLAKPVTVPTKTSNRLMACYPVAEPHLGMYSWKEETGEDYDADIAKTLLVNSMKELVDSAPDCDEAFIPNLADFFHADNSDNRTAQSGNVLDVDSRWGRVFQIGVAAKREVINLALKKHKRVVVKSGLGNHDEHSIYCLMSMMKAYFENEPRVTIDLPHNPFAYHTFGKNLIGLHHGNGVKAAELPMIMAADQAKAWGDTLHRHFLRGHIHHKEVKEYAGCIVESFRSIAAKDSWHNGAGYRAGRSMECIIYHIDGGEHGRRIVNI